MGTTVLTDVLTDVEKVTDIEENRDVLTDISTGMDGVTLTGVPCVN